ncbi:MAG TPA: class I SAM-dependent methyltransferase [Dehalococcoidia bacterium]|jgi:ubiquinone/menaquinone biosynthesis C-methylase UbiE|nr:class I SAM-dependent methyltransferase [Dehalococcoidia bacterium]
MKESINFDRAATYYDATRKLPDDVAEGITRALLAEVRAAGTDRLLEVGIGTGRMARPLMRAGLRMVGVDISAEMMGQLLAQLTPEHTPPELLLGDATALPFRDGSFKAAMVVHVLHLVASVEATVREIKRVLAPGGVLLHQTRKPHAGVDDLWRESYAVLTRLLAERGYQLKPRLLPEDIRAAISRTGAGLKVIDVTEASETSTVNEEMERIKNRICSWSWPVPEGPLVDAMPDYERWLQERTGGSWTDKTTIELEVWRW